MKKHLLFIFISLVTFQSWGQTPTLVVNDTSFFVSLTNQSLNGGFSNSTCASPTNPNLIFDKSFVTPTFFNCNSSTSELIFDTKKPLMLKNLNVIMQTNTSLTVLITIQTAPTSLGPWTTVSSNNFVSYNIYNMPLNILSPKVSRYYKILFPFISGASKLRAMELELNEIPLISPSSSTILNEGQCVTLTAAAAGETYLWSTGATTRSITVCNSGTYTVDVTNTSFLGNQDHSASIAVTKLGSQDNLPGPNGEVYSVFKNGNNVYVGGNFNAFGPITGCGAQIDTGTAIANTNLPRVDGTINATISDGNGGWFIGGLFNRVGNYTINNLAHIKSDNSVDLAFKPEPNAAVNTLALYGSSLYIGGAFTTVQTLANNYVAKVSSITGAPNLWNANVNGIVNSIQLYANQIIFGGSFTLLGGATRNYLGAVDTVFVQATSWNPNANAAVYKVHVSGTKLYAGGDFTTIGGISKQYGCGFTLPAFTTDLYNMGANGRITDFALSGTVLYAAGSFTIIGAASRNYIAALSSLNALANTAFNANADGVVNSLNLANGSLIVGGLFSNIGGAARSRIAALNLSNGTATSWNPNAVGIIGSSYFVSTLAVSGSNIYAGGSFYSVGAATRNNIACVDATTGQLTSWNPNINNIVRAIYADSNYVYIGGDFTTVNSSIAKNRIAQIIASTGIATGWNPSADNSVYALTAKGTNLFVGGTFANIGGAARAKIATLNTSTGAATTFNPTANGDVNALCVGGDSLYIGGAFTTIGGLARNRVASYNISSNAITVLNPNANNVVNALSFYNNKLYIGGTFTYLSTTARVNLAEFNVLNNTLTNLNQNAITTSGVNALFSVDSSLYQGGGFKYANQNNAINNLASVNTASSYIGYWQPQPDDIVRSIFVSNEKAYIGGRFKNITSRYQPYFASTDFFINTGRAPSVISLSNTSLCIRDTLTITGTNFVGISSVKIGSANMNYLVVSANVIKVYTSSAVAGVVAVANTLGVSTPGQSVTVNALPIATITVVGSATICQGSNVVLNANTGTGLSYQWLLNGVNIIGSTTSSYIATAAGNYTVIVTNSSTCRTTSTATTVTVNALPSASITPATTTTFCQGGNVVLNANTGTGLSYQWKLNGTNITGSTAASYTANSSGSFTVVVTNTTSTCSATSANTTVTVNAIPTASITPATTTTFCQGANVVLNANTGTGLSYQWKLNGTNITGSTAASYTASTSGNYAVIVSNAAACSATSANTTVTVNALPTATITPATTTTFCQGGNVVLNANTGTGLSYQWKLNGTNITGSTAASYTANASGSFTVLVTNTTSTCNATSSATTVTVNSIPTATITPATATTFCQGGNVVLNANTGTGLTYQWTLNGTNISGSTAANYTATNSGNYAVIVSSAAACSATSANTTVTVNALPTATITPATTTTFCQGGNVVLNANTGTGLSYQWTLNGTNISTSTAANYTATNSGNYAVIVSNAAACSSTSIATTVTVNAIPTATITPATATTFCQGGNVVLNANTGIGLTYQWTLNGTNISGSTAASYTAINSGNYAVIVSSAAACSATSTATTVTVNALPTASITPATTTTFCQGGNVVLNANTGTGLSYQWTLNGTNISGSTAASYTATTSGNYAVIVSSAAACSASSANTTVTVNVKPSTSIINGINNVLPNTTQNYSVTNTNGSNYMWIVNSGSIISGGSSNSISILWNNSPGNGLIKVLETNANGCKGDTVYLNIAINSFTLNVTPISWNFTNIDGNKQLIIFSNTNWTASSNQTWLTLNKTSGNGNDNLTATVTANTASSSRYASISFTASNLVQTISISQDSTPVIADQLSLDKDSVKVNLNQASTIIQLQSNRSWVITSPASWFTLTPSSGTGNQILSLNIQANTGGARSADVIITAGNINKFLNIKQEGVTNMNEINNLKNITIYPNPAKDELIISNTQKLNGSHIIIYDMIGRKMLEENITSATNEHTILVSELKAGAYILSIQKEGETSRIKFVKE